MKRHLIRTLSLAAVFALLMTAMSAVFMFASAKDVDNTLIFNSSNAENITEYSDAQTSYLAYRLSSDSKSVTLRCGGSLLPKGMRSSAKKIISASRSDS